MPLLLGRASAWSGGSWPSIEVNATARFQRRLELTAAPLNAAFHPRDAHAGFPRDDVLRDPVEIRPDHGLPIRRGELAHHRLQTPREFSDGGGLVLAFNAHLSGCAGRCVDVLDGADRHLVVRGRRAVVVDNHVPRGAVDPGVQAAEIPKGPEAPDDLEQHALHQIVDIGGITHPASDERAEVSVQLFPRQISGLGHNRAAILP